MSRLAAVARSIHHIFLKNVNTYNSMEAIGRLPVLDVVAWVGRKRTAVRQAILDIFVA